MRWLTFWCWGTRNVAVTGMSRDGRMDGEKTSWRAGSEQVGNHGRWLTNSFCAPRRRTPRRFSGRDRIGTTRTSTVYVEPRQIAERREAREGLINAVHTQSGPGAIASRCDAKRLEAGGLTLYVSATTLCPQCISTNRG